MIGNGSNLVVADAGVRGLVIRNRARTIERRLPAVRRCRHADGPPRQAGVGRRPGRAGVGDRGARHARRRGVGQCRSPRRRDPGPPGHRSRPGTRASGEQSVLRNDECGFGYRDSRFKHERLVVVAATWSSSSDEPDAVAARVDAFQAQRAATQPLAEQNAGSVFRNPPGDHAGRLIEAAGLKGLAVGHGIGQHPPRELHRHRARRTRGRCPAPGGPGPIRGARGERRPAGVRDRVRRRVGDGPMTRRRIGIFAGGRSAEHEVSIASAEAILREIDRERFEPYLIYIDAAGGWHLPAGPAPGSDRGTASPASWGPRPSPSTAPASTPARRAAPGALARRRSRRERGSESGRGDRRCLPRGPRSVRRGRDLQGFLELAGIPYTGAGVLASAVAMDKVVFKDLMRGHGLPVVGYASVTRRRWRSAPERVADDLVARIGSQSVVKPARLGSSVGHEPCPRARRAAARHRGGLPVGHEGHRRGRIGPGPGSSSVASSATSDPSSSGPGRS